jgi:hypothetical protein
MEMTMERYLTCRASIEKGRYREKTMYAGIIEQSMKARNRVRIRLSYRPARARICKPLRGAGIDYQPAGPVRQPYLLYWPARLHRLEESIPRNRFQVSLKVLKYRLLVSSTFRF